MHGTADLPVVVGVEQANDEASMVAPGRRCRLVAAKETRAFMTTVKLQCSTYVCSSSRASTAVAEAWEEPGTRLPFTHPAPWIQVLTFHSYTRALCSGTACQQRGHDNTRTP